MAESSPTRPLSRRGPAMPHRRESLRIALAGSAGLVMGSRATAAATLHWRERIVLGFGTTLWLRAGHDDAARLDRALDAAVQRLRDIDGVMNLFDPGSQISRLNHHGSLRSPDRHLLDVLAAACQVSAASKGLFDVTVQPLWRCWWDAAQRGQLPSDTQLEAARRQIGWRDIQLDSDVVRLGRAGMAITLNGIAQGYAAEQTARVMREHGIGHALLDTGEWAALGRAGQGADWTLRLENPVTGQAGLRFNIPPGQCVAMSSNALQLMGLENHHILDPRIGRSPAELSAVAVVASSATLADALTKPMFIVGSRQALALASHWGVGVITFDQQGQWMASPWLKPSLRAVT